MSPDTTFTPEDFDLLRDSIRGYLTRHWNPCPTTGLAESAQRLRSLWQGLAEQGLTAMAADPESGGLRALTMIHEELGRAACPVNMPAAALINIALATSADDRAISLLQDIAAGQCYPALSLGHFDGAPGCSEAIGATGDRLLRFVEGAAEASQIVVAVDERHLALLATGDGGAVVEPTPGLAEPALCEVHFQADAASPLSMDKVNATELHSLYRLLTGARALGAARRAFELAVDHARERVQFGQAIGRFQAIQHKLADCLIRLDASARLITGAAGAYDGGQDNWRYFAAAATAYTSPALRQVTLECHHVLGAIGYAEEHEAPRHFRRCHADLTRFGGPGRARQELARHLLDGGHDLPEYDIGAQGNAFRQEIREWLREYWTGERRARHLSLPLEEREFDADFTAATADLGWHCHSWPREFGGQARSPLEQLALIEEIQRSGSPRVARGEIQAHALINFGSPAQQEKFLPRLRTGEIKFCLGYSEPGAGSDLASLQTRAVRDGDEWVINGQKLWTTFAEQADYLWLAARTAPEASPPHAGISVFIVPMDAPGITVHPSMAMYGHNFCTEFLDNVRVPADALVGEENGGWKIITSALATERITMGGFVALVRANFESMLHELRSAATGGLCEDSATRDRVGELAADIEAARQLLLNSVEIMERGKVPVHEAAMSKVFTGELMEKFAESALDLFGSRAGLTEGSLGALCDGKLEHLLRRSIMMVIGGGTAEIQRNLIAQRGLGLPR